MPLVDRGCDLLSADADRSADDWRRSLRGAISPSARPLCIVGVAQRWYLSPTSGATRRRCCRTTRRSSIAADRSTSPLTAPGIPTWLSRLPGNQVFDISVQEKELAIPRLASRHDGLRIAHLSDLHMSGRITQGVLRARRRGSERDCQPDIVAITGDIVERDQCLDWIPDTLGRLRAPAACTTCSAITIDMSTCSATSDSAGRRRADSRRRQLATMVTSATRR